MFDFEELCARPLAAADYIALASAFSVLALADVPLFCAANRAAAYRFVTLVDVLYEHRCAAGLLRRAVACQRAACATRCSACREQP